MAQKKPKTLDFSNTELRDAVLELLDAGSAQDFNAAFASVMHARGIFYYRTKETYSFWFRRIRPLVTTVLNARKIRAQRATSPRDKSPSTRKSETATSSFAGLLRQGRLSGFTPEPAD